MRNKNKVLKTLKCAFLTDRFGYFGPEVNFLYGNRVSLSTGLITSISGATTFPFGPPQKKFRFRAMGHFSGLTPVFGRLAI